MLELKMYKRKKEIRNLRAAAVVTWLAGLVLIIQ